MSEMIERVAVAIWESEAPDNRTKYDLANDRMVGCIWAEYEWKDIYRHRARAAIEAMREPTLDMTEEGVAALSEWLADGKTDETDLLAVRLGLTEVWHAGIDAALRPTP